MKSNPNQLPAYLKLELQRFEMAVERQAPDERLDAAVGIFQELLFLRLAYASLSQAHNNLLDELTAEPQLPPFIRRQP
ncbi:hypothetical protein GS597_09045 [Synechococcales cyanobacterium C]|uniref:Uncharacterized protein n=1 Tax=Petrachloros mirabilis ULC683 TaxID=2781853 RepID=A0A8K1ZXD4_9CYAN|nr:hypothetical protein [Petrachloros mirabilis]NCJ06648.1 hypothetical protein [Petrachloros mirabilis ULC683]